LQNYFDHSNPAMRSAKEKNGKWRCSIPEKMKVQIILTAFVLRQYCDIAILTVHRWRRAVGAMMDNHQGRNPANRAVLTLRLLRHTCQAAIDGEELSVCFLKSFPWT
jgi:hypothetical protein